MHGLVPGPDLFTTELSATYSLFLALLVGNAIILIIGLSIITRLSYVTMIDTNYIIPIIIVLSLLGGITLNFNWFDVLIVILLGFFGYYMRKYNYSIIAFILGIVLGEIAERNFLRSLQLSDGSFMIFVGRAQSILILVAIVFILFGPYLIPAIKARIG